MFKRRLLLTMNIDGLERSTGFSGASRLSTGLLFVQELLPVLRSKGDRVSDGISDRRSIGKRAKKSLGPWQNTRGVEGVDYSRRS